MTVKMKDLRSNRRVSLIEQSSPLNETARGAWIAVGTVCSPENGSLRPRKETDNECDEGLTCVPFG